MSTTPILHHYPASPFSEKVRVALGLKGLTYASVRIPAVLPKPDVVALTGGYRRTPLLQLGSHVFCDTALILRVLERLAPSPALYAHPAAETLAQWADAALFDVAVSLASRPTKLDTVLELMLPEELQKFAEDRKAMRVGGSRNLPAFQTACLHLPVYLERIGRMLEASAFLLGDGAGAADLAVYHCLWFIDMLNPDRLPQQGPVRAFMDRIKAIGHGTPEPMTAQEALEVCRAGGDVSWTAGGSVPVEGIEPGTRVRICADDWGRDAVEGELLTSGEDELAITRTDDRAGLVTVHFPRVGYEIRLAD